MLVAFTDRSWSQTIQGEPQPAYLNPGLPVDDRVDDLVSRMTLEEKASQVVHSAAAIPRLQVPAYNWWTEALHGVAWGSLRYFPSLSDWPQASMNG